MDVVTTAPYAGYRTGTAATILDNTDLELALVEIQRPGHHHTIAEIPYHYLKAA